MCKALGIICFFLKNNNQLLRLNEIKNHIVFLFQSADHCISNGSVGVAGDPAPIIGSGLR